MTAGSPAADAALSSDRALRRLFLTLFLRGRSARGLRKSDVPQSVASKLSWTLVLYAGVGCVALAFLLGPVFQLSLYLHGTTMVLCGMFIAASAGEVLFNKEEADILLHRPITPQALLRAKIIVLLEVSLWMAGAFNLAGTLGGLAAPGATIFFPLAHIISTVLEALFGTSLVVLGYELCLRFFGREKLEGVMTAVQILVAIVAVLAGQVPRLLGYVDLRHQLNASPWWLNLLPPAWFAGFDDALAGSGAGKSWILGAIGVSLTALVVWLALGRMARHYETGLQMLGEANAAPRASGGQRRWLDALVHTPPFRWWLRQPINRASFLLTTSYLLRDRDVKLRVYPAIAPMLVMPFLFLLPGRHEAVGISSFGIAFAGGYLGMAPLFALNLLQYSQQWQAADIFHFAPMPGPAPLCAGARQAVTCFLTVPLVLGFTLIVVCLHRETTNLFLMLPGLMTLPIFTLIPHLGGRAVPFSKAGEEAKSARRGLDLFIVMIISVGLSFLSTRAWDDGWFRSLLLGEAAVATIAYVLMRRSLASMRWPSAE
ncbi:MAG: hypothetical protein ABJF10_22465 [Chthoniobacter sp.]|uniref:hypothetical protein n=1 Tax=Chthoniobacter sp. TaxID=2510640 RepID=UPI0032A63E57